MTKKNQLGRRSAPDAKKVEQAADKLGIANDTEEGRKARLMLRVFIPVMVRAFHRRQSDTANRLTPKQELKRVRRFRKTLREIAEQMEDGWAYARMKDCGYAFWFWSGAWRDDPDRERIFDADADAVVERSLEEELAAIGKLDERMESIETSLNFLLAIGESPSLGHEGKNASKEAVHWLAYMSLVFHKGCLITLQPEVTGHQFVAWTFGLAGVGEEWGNPDRNANVRYYVNGNDKAAAVAVEKLHEK